MKLSSPTLCLALGILLSACAGDDGTQPAIPEGIASLAELGVVVQPGHAGAGADSGPALGEADFSAEEGPFEVELATRILSLRFRVDGPVHAREPVHITLQATPWGDSTVPATVTIDFGDGRPHRTFEIVGELEFDYVFRQPGKYRMFAVLEDADGDTARRGFRVRVREQRAIDLQVQGVESIRPGQTSRLRFVATDSNAAGESNVSGELLIDFGNGSTARLRRFDGDVTRTVVYHLRSRPYILRVELITDTGIKIEDEIQVWVDHDPGPGGPTGPTGPTGPVDGDSVDLSRAIIAANSDQDIASFRVTSEVTGVSITPSQICVSHTMAGRWPSLDGSEGNPWIAVYLDGELHAGTYEYLRSGQVCKGITASNLADHIKHGPLGSYFPRQGDVVHFFVSTLARLGYYTTNERSNVVETVWPY